MTNKKENSIDNSIKYIGCCGAYCRTCPPFLTGHCKGCKLGYSKKERDINKAKCKIKVCCFKENRLETCADCHYFCKCSIINGFYNKNGFKYGKYKQQAEFIKQYGYAGFIKEAKNWKSAYGKLSS